MILYLILNFPIFFNIYPDYVYILNNFYWESQFYSKEFQDFKIDKLINDLEKEEYELLIGNDYRIKMLKEKEIKKLNIQWRFSRAMFKIEEDKSIDSDASIGTGYLSSDESLKRFTIKKSKLKQNDIKLCYKLKQKYPIEICKEYRNEKRCFFYYLEYYFIIPKSFILPMDNLTNKKLRFSIVGVDDGLHGWSNTKNLKIYALIKDIS